jgi:hypothetical protein
LRTIEAGRGRSERRQLAAAEVLDALARLYRGFVAWGSLYGDLDLREEQEQRREEVAGLLGELTGNYFPRSMWLGQRACESVENFIRKSEDLYSEFCREIEERGYEQARLGMATRASKELGPLRKEAEAALKADPAEPRWRRRLRGIVGGG